MDKENDARVGEDEVDYWSWPEGYEAAKALIKDVPEDQKDMWFMNAMVSYVSA